MAENISLRKLRKSTYDVRQRSESEERKREAERKVKELEKQIREYELRNIQRQQEMIRSERRRAAALRQANTENDFMNEIPQETTERLSGLDQHHVEDDINLDQSSDATDIAFSQQIEELDKRFTSYSQQRYSTPYTCDREQSPKRHSDTLRLRQTKNSARDNVGSISYDTGLLRNKPRQSYEKQTFRSKSFMDVDNKEVLNRKEEMKLDDRMRDNLIDKERVRGECYIKREASCGEYGNQTDISATTALLEEEERKLLLIRQRRKELQEILEMEKLQQMKMEQEKQRRIEETEMQKQLLEQYEIREKEMALKEQTISKQERELETKLQELQLMTDKIRTGQPDVGEQSSYSLMLKSKEEELRKREQALLDRQKELDRKESLFRARYNAFKELDSTERNEVVENDVSEPHRMTTELLKEFGKKQVIETTQESIRQEDIHTFGPKLSISQFSGTEPKPKSESSFEEWKREIESVIATRLYKEHVIAQAIRHSLKGQAKKVLINLSPTATPTEIIARVEDIFGDLSSQQFIYTEFYTAEQKSDESIAEWGLRLEEILLLASNKRTIPERERNDMLKDKFWRSLYDQDIKNATRNSFESGDSFEVLRRKARAEENEMKLTKQRKQTSQGKPGNLSGTEKNEDILTKLMKKMDNFEKKLEEMKGERQIHNTSNKQCNGTSVTSSTVQSSNRRGHYYNGYSSSYNRGYARGGRYNSQPYPGREHKKDEKSPQDKPAQQNSNSNETNDLNG